MAMECWQQFFKWCDIPGHLDQAILLGKLKTLWGQLSISYLVPVLPI